MCKPTNGPKVESTQDDYQWHAMSVDESATAMKLGKNYQANGLTTAEAKQRFEQYGPNQLTEKARKTLFAKIWEQVANVLVAILVVVAVVSLVKGIISEDAESRLTNFIEVGLITFVIVLNTFIGVYQEGAAESAAEALKGMLSSDAVLVRDGKQQNVPATDIVPGDIVMLGLGDKVPADIRLLEVNNLATQEAALTGESVPIDKITTPIAAETGDPRQTPLGDRKNMCFSATLVAQGTGVGLIVRTGDNTEIGTINSLVNNVEEKKTAVLEQIDFIAKILACFIAVTALATWLVAFFMLEANGLDSLTIALTCAVAMIPEGLQAIVTMTYSYSVAKMAKENAIVRKLPAVETLGSVTVICSDKTGTLTTNIMSMMAFVTSNAHYKNDVDSQERTVNNLVRDDSYKSTRAVGSKGKSTADVIHSGPSAHRAGKTTSGFSMHGKDSFHGAKDDGLIEDLPSPADGAAPTKTDAYPFAEGSAPSAEFVRQGLACGVLCSKCVLGKNGTREGEIGNPTELSILRAVYASGVDVEKMKADSPIVAEVPFSSEYKFMATVHESSKANDGDSVPADSYVVYAKGAPDRMVKLCSLQAKAGTVGEMEPIDAAYWTEKIATLSSHGLRVLALCRGTVKKDEVKKGDQLKAGFVNGRDEPWLCIQGLCAIMDPPRPECVDAIATAHTAGVRVAMITGDHKDTAIAIGDQLGLVDEIYSDAVTGPELDAMSDAEIRQSVMKYNIFARASPQNKIQIVKALQEEGQICSMTGDGVNDAPALKAADMGVAMGKEGTDVAREASEMILADDNFATIVYAVREGRTVWDNLRKVLFINTPINNAQGLSVLFGIICGLPDTVLTPIQVLYCNLICAVTLGFVAAVEPAEEGIMNLPPRRQGKRLIGRFLLLRIILATIVLVATTVGSVFLVQDLTLGQQRSQALNTLSFGACAITLSARFSYLSSISMRSFKGNPVSWISVITMVVLQVAITYIPGVNTTIFSMEGMTGMQWVIVAGFMVLTFLIMEAEKAFRSYLKNLGEDT
eukprot:CAMPEP_0113486780 /NCGR_PEP_ID=MMETSP0014_2-20120614/25170_1 /TAXON_ID=2857 /ORGANISM="Nitzschia sp." /LENGTH=1027 /DNA_ID=CAMNT_0000380457 /DNA_START=995 /DNA_END=4074 /DNA_ORIENTATION=+ /assembly_acc=CAM_ASM_000159